MPQKKGAKRPVGHPVTRWTPKALSDLNTKLLQYIRDTDIPIIAEFAYLNDVRRQFLYESPALADSIKKCTEKKESQLERMSLKGEVNTTQAIFSLKQLGWTDRQEIKHGGSLRIQYEVVDADSDK